MTSITDQLATLADGAPAADPRLNWSEWAMGLATAVAARADCSRAHAGAVIMTADMRIVATGFKGLRRARPAA
ncbi:hypothetical protein ACTHQ6_09835 [Arthrobacter sp. SAFR-179]|uniref:hypothetical protein n=1 Tax=Arthrobacter sp. SAFR-179 TaxID=3387279 RepID=UPI003F7B4637